MSSLASVPYSTMVIVVLQQMYRGSKNLWTLKSHLKMIGIALVAAIKLKWHLVVYFMVYLFFYNCLFVCLYLSIYLSIKSKLHHSLFLSVLTLSRFFFVSIKSFLHKQLFKQTAALAIHSDGSDYKSSRCCL